MINNSNHQRLTISSQSIENRRKQYFKNLKNYIDRRMYMTFDETETEKVLLSLEKKIYFGTDKKISVFQFTRDMQNKFIQNLLCCSQNFQTFDDYLKHVYLTHQEYQNQSKEDDVNTTEDDIDYDFYDRILNRSKIYCCNAHGCTKRYTSAYGLRYHLENGHSSFKIFKRFLCTFTDCNKSYKNANGLKYHLKNGH